MVAWRERMIHGSRLWSLIIIADAAGVDLIPDTIDRHAVVSRHNPSVTNVNTSEVAVLGNGAFALSIDVTGLQTLNGTYSGVPNASSPFQCNCPAHADVSFPLMTSADWAWHSFKPPGSPGSKADPFAEPQYGSFWDRWRVSSNRSAMRESWMPTGSAAAGPSRKGPDDPDLRAAMEWRGSNPHRFSLGQIALRKLDSQGMTVPIDAEEVSAINQTLNVWAGLAHSRFELGGEPVVVDTVVHGKADLVSTRVETPLLVTGSLGVALSFGGGTGAKSGANWTIEGAHRSEIVVERSGSNSVLLRRTLDYDSYFVRVSFSSGYEFARVGAHAFVVRPLPQYINVLRTTMVASARLWVSVGFVPTTQYGIMRFLPAQLLNGSNPDTLSDAVARWLPKRWSLACSLMGTGQGSSTALSAGLNVEAPMLPDFDGVSNSSASHWREYWSTGGMIDLSAAFALNDSRPAELERRVILSLYLHGAQEAGFVFNSESGLIQNSWSGKFHMVRGVPF